MTPHAFISKWERVELTERQASQEWFVDLYSLARDRRRPAVAEGARARSTACRGRPGGVEGAAGVESETGIAGEVTNERGKAAAVKEEWR